MRAPRNKTLQLTTEEETYYLARTLSPVGKLSLAEMENKTLLGDTFKILPLLPEKSVDLLIADPPYNLSKDFHGNHFRQRSLSEYEEYTEEWVKAVLPLLKDTATIYVCCDPFSSIAIAPVLLRYFHFRNRITWEREKGRGAKTNWKNSMEDIWFFTVSDEFTFHVEDVMMRRRVLAPYRAEGVPKDWEETADGKFRNTCPSNFWDDISVPYWSMAENTMHPTQKPEKLLAKLILASSSEGDLVFDPFLGSGSTSVTAKKLKRRFAGIEQNPTYCAWCEKRLEVAEQDPSIQGYSGGVFWERNTTQIQKKYEK